MSNLGDTQVVTGEVRFSYVNLFEAKKFRDTDAEGKYSVTILVPKTDTRTVEAIKAATEKLTTVFYSITEQLYKQTAANQQAQANQEDANTETNTENNNNEGNE